MSDCLSIPKFLKDTNADHVGCFVCMFTVRDVIPNAKRS